MKSDYARMYLVPGSYFVLEKCWLFGKIMSAGERLIPTRKMPQWACYISGYPSKWHLTYIKRIIVEKIIIEHLNCALIHSFIHSFNKCLLNAMSNILAEHHYTVVNKTGFLPSWRLQSNDGEQWF